MTVRPGDAGYDPDWWEKWGKASHEASQKRYKLPCIYCGREARVWQPDKCAWCSIGIRVCAMCTVGLKGAGATILLCLGCQKDEVVGLMGLAL